MTPTQSAERQDFKEDLRFINRKLRDMRADSQLLGFGADEDLLAAQSNITNLLGRMEVEDMEDPTKT